MVSTMLSSGPKQDGLAQGVERVLRNGKRVFGQAYKESLVERCLQLGTSVSRVALDHGINANLLRKWIDKRVLSASAVATLLPVMIDARPEPQPSTAPARGTKPSAGLIEIEIGRVRVRLRGAIDTERLSVVLEAVARHT